MRVLHICSNFDPFYLDFIGNQVELQMYPKVFYFRAIERGLPSLNEDYLDIRLNYSQKDRFWFKKKQKKVSMDFFDLYSKEDYDVIHAHTLFSNGYIAYLAKKEWGFPYIVAVRDMDINVFFRYRILLRKIGLEILQNAEHIIFLSNNYKDELFRKYIPEKERSELEAKSIIIPNGINDFFHENRLMVNNKRERNVNNNEITILTVGHIIKRKNHLSVCKALEILKNNGKNVKYIIVGKALDKKLLKKIKKYPFVEYSEFLPKEKLIEMYRKADIFVMPSITETFGLTYVEAISQGLPVIYSKGQGFDGQFEEGEVGYACNNINPVDIAEKIKKVLKNYDKITFNLQNKAIDYNWNEINLKYMELYKNMVKGEI